MYNTKVQKRYDHSKKGKARHNTKKYLEYHKEYNRVYGALYRERRKRLIIEHYGNKCACCGETEFRFLSVDHIKGGGSKHIQEITKSGHNFYSWIFKNNFPKGFQILCHNCNRAKGNSGKQFCPVHHPELYKEDENI